LKSLKVVGEQNRACCQRCCSSHVMSRPHASVCSCPEHPSATQSCMALAWSQRLPCAVSSVLPSAPRTTPLLPATVARNLLSPSAPSSPQAIYAMTRDHRNNQQRVTGTGEATGVAAVPAAAGPCGPASTSVNNSPAAQSPIVYYVRDSAGAWIELANPRLGEGPSSAPLCPGPNYVWLRGRGWQPVINRRPYATVSAGCSNPQGSSRGTVLPVRAAHPQTHPKTNATSPRATRCCCGALDGTAPPFLRCSWQ